MTTPCTQPGCTGTVLDGYCDVCGTPAPAGTLSQSAVAGVAITVASTPMGRAAQGSVAQGSVGTGAVGQGPAGDDFSQATQVSSSAASNRLASAPIGSARATATGSRTTRKVGTSSTRLRGARLGAGITTVPPIPTVDAAKAIMVNPEVPEDRRSCPNCGNPVGRSREGRPGRTEGFCPNCRTQFSFTPKLKAGDLVGGQYEVAGCLAHGGLGWIYLAQDRNVSNRWVVLKGLLNSGDPDALAAAIAERQFLAQVEHPLIVEIYNFVTHEGAGYIVMEYVGGTSLKSILKDRMRANHGVYDALPLDQAIAFILEVLPAFQYLHDLGLLYCDFKPDNIIQVGDAVKLIDLGGVRRIDDFDSAIYGTVGYQAPEVPQVGPSVASDVFTIGRTLAVLAFEFRGYQSRFVTSLPPVADVPLFQKYDSLYRLLAKACAPDPADRFASADELRVQLLGVLREVVAIDRAEAQGSLVATPVPSSPSLLFEAPTVADDRLDWNDLPLLRTDESDPQAGWLRTVSVDEPAARLTALKAAPGPSVEVHLATAYAALAADQPQVVDNQVSALLNDDPWEWRAVWVSGLAALRRADMPAARAALNAVYGQVPGELAPKLALAVACERSGEADVAEALYIACARTDAAYTAPAAFGLERIRRSRGDLDGAVAALDLIPPTSRAFTLARRLRAGLLAGSGRGLPSLAAALGSIETVTIDAHDRARLSADVYRAALDEVLSTGPQPNLRIGPRAATEHDLRDGLEGAYRELGGYAPTREEKVRLVDEANRVRRWTLR
jgi:serine/threonine-protein kinase PknG